MQVFGDILTEDERFISLPELESALKKTVIQPKYRISVLNPDETVAYQIPDEDIPVDGINYSETYQNGQRRSLTLTLINRDGQYTPSIDRIWINTRFKFEVGIKIKNSILWFPKGIYLLGDTSYNYQDSNRVISLMLKDKYSLLEGKTGTLEDGYEISLGSNIENAIRGLLNTSMQNGYVLDYKEPIFDSSFAGKKTQCTIRINEGGNLASIIDQLALQLSAEYYYNTVGNLCFYPINATVSDAAKPVIWNFEELDRGVNNFSMNYRMEDVINVIKVVGSNTNSLIYSSIKQNNNPNSPICIERIGRRAAPTYNESAITSQEAADDLANYYLRQYSFLGIDFSCEIAFNPTLTVNNICEVENKVLDYAREKLLITELTYTSSSGIMSLRMCNTSELPFMYRGNRG